LNKKARLILHDNYPIMAYYNPIILDDIPIKLLLYAKGTTCTRSSLARFLDRLKFFPRAKDLNCERSKGTNVSITEVYYLVMYIIS
jgi:hypothetical protein